MLATVGRDGRAPLAARGTAGRLLDGHAGSPQLRARDARARRRRAAARLAAHPPRRGRAHRSRQPPPRGQRRADRHHRRAGRLRQDDTAHAVGRARPAPVCVALARRSRRRRRRAVERLGRGRRAAAAPLAVASDLVRRRRRRRPRPRTAALVVAALAENIPAGSTLALAARSEPRLPLARLRAEGGLLELGPDDLALTPKEAQSLLRHAGVLLPGPEVAELGRRTEGWPAGLYLAALSLRSGGDPWTFSGDDRFVADYLRAEHLAPLTPTLRRFLMRTSVLERMSPEICDAVLERKDSARQLDALERSSLLVVPLDRSRSAYRYRRLVRDFLCSELERLQPELVTVLNRRAADWCEANGAPEAAVDYAAAAGDFDHVARLVSRLALPAYQDGRIVMVERWLRLLVELPDARAPSRSLPDRRLGACAARPRARRAALGRRSRAGPRRGRPAAAAPARAPLLRRDGADARRRPGRGRRRPARKRLAADGSRCARRRAASRRRRRPRRRDACARRRGGRRSRRGGHADRRAQRAFAARSGTRRVRRRGCARRRGDRRRRLPPARRVGDARARARRVRARGAAPRRPRARGRTRSRTQTACVPCSRTPCRGSRCRSASSSRAPSSRSPTSAPRGRCCRRWTRILRLRPQLGRLVEDAAVLRSQLAGARGAGRTMGVEPDVG